MTTIAPERLSRIEGISLSIGNHSSIDAGACVMEVVSYVAGEPWSDHPQCACPIITSFMIGWNDGLPSNADRDRLLKPIVPLLAGTRSTKEVEQRRGFMAMDWIIREFTPAWLDMVPSLKVYAETLRKSPEIIDVAGLLAITPVLTDVAKHSAAAWDATSDATSAAAWDAAWAAASAAAWDAAWDAAWAAAWDAAWAAASDATSAAAWDAAWAAASAAAWDALKPTTDNLQQSALALVHRMIAAK